MRSVRIPSYRLHRASGQAVVTIHGRDIYLGTHGSDASKREYDRLITRLKTERTARCNPRLTIGQLVLLFDGHAESYYRKNSKPTGEAATFKYACRPLVEKFSRTLVIDFGPNRLKSVRQAMIDSGLARPTINGYVARIVQIFRWGVGEEIVPVDILNALEAVPGLKKGRTKAREPEPVRPVETAHINAVLPHLSRQVADMVRLQLLTGCRPGEIVQLRPCDLNRDGDIWEFTPGEHKTEHRDRQRRIFFGPRAQAILEQWIDNRPADAFCFSPKEAEAERHVAMRAARKTPVQPSQRNRQKAEPARPPGERYDSTSYRRAIHRAVKAANDAAKEHDAEAPEIPAWSPNRLRHSRATDIRRQFGLEAAQTILGHSELGVTQVYAERDFDAARRVMAEIG